MRSGQARSGTLTGKPARQGRTPVNAYGLRGSRFFPVCCKQTKVGKKLGGPQILDRIFAASILRTPSHEDAIKPTLPSPLFLLYGHRAPAGAAPRQTGASRARGNARGRCPRAAARTRAAGPRARGANEKAEARPKAGATLIGCCESASQAVGMTLVGRRSSRSRQPRSSGRSAIARCAAIPPGDRHPNGPKPACRIRRSLVKQTAIERRRGAGRSLAK